jgi:hypothetical protein
MHSTNYTNTFIEVAEDCKNDRGTSPPEKQPRTIAGMQFEMLREKPYTYTSDDLLFAIFAERNGIVPSDYAAQRAAFFSKGQPCLRSSPLAKQYGWGLHFDGDGRIALYGCESGDYERFQNDASLTHHKAMKSARC